MSNTIPDFKLMFLSLWWAIVFSIKYRKQGRIRQEGMVTELRTPYRVYGFYLSQFEMVERLENPKSVHEMFKKRRVTKEGLPFLFSHFMRVKYPTYIVHLGKKSQEVYRGCLVMYKGEAFMLGEVFTRHALNPFDIMKDYNPEYNRWILSSSSNSSLIASFSEGRDPEVVVYDAAHEQYMLNDLMSLDNMERRSGRG